jgi:hypothetical protein
VLGPDTDAADACCDEGSFEGFVDVASILRHLLTRLDPALLSEDACGLGSSVSDAVRVMDALTARAPSVLHEARVADAARKDGDLLYRGFSGTTLLDVLTAAFLRPFHLRDVHVCHRVRSHLFSVCVFFLGCANDVDNPQVAAADVRPELDAATSLRSVSAHSMSIISHMDLIWCAGTLLPSSIMPVCCQV